MFFSPCTPQGWGSRKPTWRTPTGNCLRVLDLERGRRSPNIGGGSLVSWPGFVVGGRVVISTFGVTVFTRSSPWGSSGVLRCGWPHPYHVRLHRSPRDVHHGTEGPSKEAVTRPYPLQFPLTPMSRPVISNSIPPELGVVCLNHRRFPRVVVDGVKNLLLLTKRSTFRTSGVTPIAGW